MKYLEAHMNNEDFFSLPPWKEADSTFSLSSERENNENRETNTHRAKDVACKFGRGVLALCIAPVAPLARITMEIMPVSKWNGADNPPEKVQKTNFKIHAIVMAVGLGVIGVALSPVLGPLSLLFSVPLIALGVTALWNMATAALFPGKDEDSGESISRKDAALQGLSDTFHKSMDLLPSLFFPKQLEPQEQEDDSSFRWTDTNEKSLNRESISGEGLESDNPESELSELTSGEHKEPETLQSLEEKTKNLANAWIHRDSNDISQIQNEYEKCIQVQEDLANITTSSIEEKQTIKCLSTQIETMLRIYGAQIGIQSKSETK
jgi:hypothetical protein